MKILDTKFVVRSEATASFWVNEEGFSAPSAEEATKMDFKTANRLALQFWKADAKIVEVSA
jgi:hypothetical protein